MLFCSKVNKWGHRFKGTGCTCTNSKRCLKQIRTKCLSVFVLHPKHSLWHFSPKLTQTQPQSLLWWYWQVTCWVGVLKLGFIPEWVKLVVARTVVSPDSVLRTPQEPSNTRGGECTDWTSLLLILPSVLGFLFFLHLCVPCFFFPFFFLSRDGFVVL